jgi:hypothetical protein
MKITEYMTAEEKIEAKKQLYSETKLAEVNNMPELHLSLEDLNAQLGDSKLNNETVIYTDIYGKQHYAVISKRLGNPLFYKPGKYRYGAANYVPSYEESVLLSKSTNPYNVENSKVIDVNQAAIIQKIENRKAMDQLASQ